MHSKAIPAGRYGGPPIHPGTILRDEFTAPLGLSTYALAKALKVPQTRLGEIMAGRRSITADTALRLSRYFETSPALWLNLQAAYDLRIAEIEHGAAISAEVKTRVAEEP
jgi:addiction module HigA family antidote